MVEQHVLDDLTVESQAVIWRDLIEDRFTVLLVLDEDAIVGACAVAAPSRDEDEPRRVAEFFSVNVDPDLFREGIGWRLIQGVIDHVSTGEWDELTCWALTENVAAQRLYAGLGFEADGAQKKDEFWLLPDIRLRLALS
jgi:ribosomal protein S18 acetylase RimI-like enzyme